MAIDVIPARFYSALSESNTLVARLFVSNFVISTNMEDEAFMKDSTSANNRRKITAPTSPRSSDRNNNISVTTQPFGKKRRLTSDNFKTEYNIGEATGFKSSCEHLNDMVSAETDLEIFGFCNPHFVKGLVPERFLPSLVAFRDRVAPPKNTPDILQHTTTSSDPPDLTKVLRQFARRAGWDMQGVKEQGLGTNEQKYEQSYEQTREDGTVEKLASKIVICSNCGCYIWAKPR